jgi:hypothetical protein
VVMSEGRIRYAGNRLPETLPFDGQLAERPK